MPCSTSGRSAWPAAQSFVTEGNVLLRRFYCPSCGTTLDAETALPGEAFLVDHVRG